MKVLAISLLWVSVSATCPPEGFDSNPGFDLDAYAATRWYIQQMMVTSYLPQSHNFCVYADYSRLAKRTLTGYDVHVHNHAEEKDGTLHDSDKDIKFGGIDAKIIDAKRGKLAVGPWFVPSSLAGPYWVLAYNDAEGWSLVSGGPPTEPGDGGKCRTGTETNNSGLWIFTRAQKRDDAIIAKARALAEAKGFDLSVLNDVDQSNCKESSASSIHVEVV